MSIGKAFPICEVKIVDPKTLQVLNRHATFHSVCAYMIVLNDIVLAPSSWRARRAGSQELPRDAVLLEQGDKL